MRGKERIKVDIKINPKLAAKRKSISSFAPVKRPISERCNAHV